MVADSEEEEEEEEKEEEEGNVGGFEKLSKWFRGLADLGEPSAPEQQMESYNTLWKIENGNRRNCSIY